MANDSTTPMTDDYKDAAQRSQEAGIADETAAFDVAAPATSSENDQGEQDEPSDEEAAAQLGSLS